MSASMSLEEKFEALMKNCEYLKAQNEEKEAQNHYLRRQLETSMKEKRKVMRSSSSSRRTGSGQGRREEEEGPYRGSSSGEDSPRYPRREPRHPAHHFNDFKIDIPEFEGKLDPDDFLEWLQTVERVFEFKEIPEEKKVKIVALKLRSFASLWWTHLLAKRVRQGKKKIRTWEKMKSKLKARFLPPTYLHKKYSLPHHLTPTLPTFDEVCMLAHKVEQPPKRELVKPPPKEQPLNKGSSSYPSKPVTPSFPIPQKNQAPQKILTPQNRPNPIPTTPRRCFKCQGLGHIASECPNRQIVPLAEWEANKEEEEKEDQRENIFHSRCTVQEKVCSLIIDGGSCANMASSNMVKKLGLHAAVHPHPYDLQWINQGKGLLVNSWCLISLSIGKNYQDEIWCDIIPMEACHILLGRPWLFDRKVSYDGFLNTYTFSKDGKKITLAPLSPSQSHKHKTLNTKPQPGLILTSSESFLKAPHLELKAFKDETLSSLKKPKASNQAQTHKHKKRLVFHSGDLVWVNVRKERFSFKKSSKLVPREDGPFEILARVNDHAYKVYLPGDFGVPATFNVADLSPYLDTGEELPSLRTNFSQVGEDDGDHPHVLSLVKAIQISSWVKQESKDQNGLIKAPWTVFDPGKGQL